MKYIDAEKLKKLIDEKWKELADKNVKVGGGKWDAEISIYLSVLRLVDILQQEQPEVDLEKEYNTWWNSISGKINVEHMMEWYMHETARHFYNFRNAALEKAAQYVYESWMGGTMDDFRRDIVELGKVLNERKEK